jgi:peroxiredoxin
MAAISVDERAESAELAERLLISFPLLSDPALKVALAYGVAMEGRDIAIPSIFIVTSDRRIRYKYVGESPADRPSTNKLLAEVDRVIE